MKIHHISITVKDYQISKEFYSKFFGFQEVSSFRREDMKAAGHFLEGENYIIELWQFDEANEGTRENLEFTGIKHIAFVSDNIEADHNRFEEGGIACGPVNTGASGGQYFFLSDPDGNQIEIYKAK